MTTSTCTLTAGREPGYAAETSPYGSSSRVRVVRVAPVAAPAPFCRCEIGVQAGSTPAHLAAGCDAWRESRFERVALSQAAILQGESPRQTGSMRYAQGPTREPEKGRGAGLLLPALFGKVRIGCPDE